MGVHRLPHFPLSGGISHPDKRARTSAMRRSTLPLPRASSRHATHPIRQLPRADRRHPLGQFWPLLRRCPARPSWLSEHSSAAKDWCDAGHRSACWPTRAHRTSTTRYGPSPTCSIRRSATSTSETPAVGRRRRPTGFRSGRGARSGSRPVHHRSLASARVLIEQPNDAPTETKK